MQIGCRNRQKHVYSADLVNTTANANMIESGKVERNCRALISLLPWVISVFRSARVYVTVVALSNLPYLLTVLWLWRKFSHVFPRQVSLWLLRFATSFNTFLSPIIHRSFVSWKSACDVNPCHNNSTCQSGFTDQRYRCVCAPGFTGEDCGQGKKKWIENDFVFLPFLLTPLPEGCCGLRIILRASFDFIFLC